MNTPQQIPFGKPWITDDDRHAVMEVLQGTVLTHGPQCKQFESDFSRFVGEGCNSVTVSSCMAALHLSYLHFGIGPQDEVIVPAQTHSATVHAVEWVGAKPVFVDCDPETGNITAEAINKALTAKTKAISVVHFLGMPCDMAPIMDLANTYKLKVIEDCAIALGARINGKHVGLFGDSGCYSFYPVKHMTTGEGGMFISKNAETVQKVALLRAFGVNRKHDERTIPGMYDVESIGLNYRMSEMQAALGVSQLKRMEENLLMRQSNFEVYQERLAGFDKAKLLYTKKEGFTHSHYCVSVVLDDSIASKRDTVVHKLNEKGIGTSIYYPLPVPFMSFYQKKYKASEQNFPNALKISRQSIALPTSPHVSPHQIGYIVDTLKHIIKELA